MTREEELKCQICGEICKRGVKVTCCSAIGCRACCVKAVTRDKKCWNASCGAAITSKDLVNDDELRGKVDKYMAQKKAEADKPVLAELPTPVPTNQKKGETETPGLPTPVPTNQKNIESEKTGLPTPVPSSPMKPETPSTKKTDTPPSDVPHTIDTASVAVPKITDTPLSSVIKNIDTTSTAGANKTNTPLSPVVIKTNTPTTAAETESSASLATDKNFPPPVSTNKSSSPQSGQKKNCTSPSASDSNSTDTVTVNQITPSNDTETKTGNEPPPKKQKVPIIQEKENTSGKVTVSLDMMKQRNQEFDQNLNEVEKASKELRYGALLELMFTFSNVNAKCRMCFDEIKSDFMVLKHIQMKHKDLYQNFKVVLSAPNLNQLNLFLHKAIKAEFLYAQKGEFPIPVDC